LIACVNVDGGWEAETSYFGWYSDKGGSTWYWQ